MTDKVRIRFKHNGNPYRARVSRSELKKDGTPKISTIRRIDLERQAREKKSKG